MDEKVDAMIAKQRQQEVVITQISAVVFKKTPNLNELSAKEIMWKKISVGLRRMVTSFVE